MAQEGQKIGHYRLISVLGRGGMGEVYRAEDLQLPRQVAIKVIHVEGAMRQGAVQDALRLFKREAQAIASLQHPYILPLYEYGEESINTAILTYMVMPICAEGSLVDWLDKHRSVPLAPIEVAHFLKQAAEALQEAHDHSIIHQDIKPANFLIRPRKGTTLPDLLLADFGVAKLTSATASMSQSVRGTPYYMAPEQWKGKPQPATDQYALSVMAYELLTGQLPFQGSTETLMYQHIFEPATPLNQINARISPTLSNVVLRAMAKEPADRFPSVLDFAHAFEHAVQNKANGAARRSTVEGFPGRNIDTTITITDIQARSGTTKGLTLPDGRRISVTIPANTQNNAVIRLPERGELSETGGPTGALLVHVTVRPVSNIVPPSPPKITKPEVYRQQMVTPKPEYRPVTKRPRYSAAFVGTMTFGGTTILACLVIILIHFSIGFLILGVLTGLIMGVLASVLLRGGTLGIIGDIVIGMVGSFIGAYIGYLVLGGGDIINAFIGSCVFIAILRLLTRRPRL